jgi:tRNA (guanine37-N1)-methyltransferase
VRIDVISAVPAILESPLNESILKRAQDNDLVELHIHNLRDYAHDRHLTVDDVPYGGGAGMVLKPEPIFECVEALKAQRQYDEFIYLSAEGERFDQKMAARLSLCSNLLFLCGHYKGVDERVRESLITKEISIGDFVLTGGELPALVVIDAVVRLIPGVLHDGESALSDSFQDHLLDCPWYTRPPVYREMKVPEVLLSGNHAEIEKWREEKRLQRTRTRRKDLLE